jgi:hypothetical protein
MRFGHQANFPKYVINATCKLFSKTSQQAICEEELGERETVFASKLAVDGGVTAWPCG